MAESEEEIKILLMTMKEESEKAGLNLKKWRSRHLVPITSWKIDGETMETLTDFIFLGSKITADGDCSHEIKRRFLLGRKAMTKLDSMLKSRVFANKGLSSQSYGFSSSHVWMWQLDHKEAWVSKNWCFRTVVLDKTLQSPLDGEKPNESILKEIIPEYSLEGLMLKLKLQYFGHLMWRANSLGKALMLGKRDGKRRSRQQKMRQLDSITNSVDMNLSKL